MLNWIDVNEGDWFYDEIVEASRIELEDGEPFIKGIPYTEFEIGAPFIYEEKVAGAGQKVFTLDIVIEPTPDNPLFVYIDGVQTVYKDVRNPGTTPITTEVELYYAPKEGAIVSFASFGIPKVDDFTGKPVSPISTPEYPSYFLSDGANYYYDKFSRKYNEYLYAFGKALKRADVPDIDWGVMEGNEVAEKYIGLNTDIYCVAPWGKVFLPYNLNNVTCKFVYTVNENGFISQKSVDFKPTSSSVWYNNRFFPNAKISRAEAFVLIDRLRKTFYSRFTDLDAPTYELDQTIVAYQGQKVFKLNGTYPAGKGILDVEVNGVNKDVGVDYIEVDNHTVEFTYPLYEGDEVRFSFSNDVSTRFQDVGYLTSIYNQDTGEFITVDGRVSNSWWSPHVLAMEQETFEDGEYLIQGIDITKFRDGYPVVDSYYEPVPGVDDPQKYFMPNTLLTRAQAVTFLNRFRKWCIERFK